MVLVSLGHDPSSQSASSSALPVASERAALAQLAAPSGSVRVVWLSIDPRSGQVHLYPAEAVARLERAHQAGTAVQVPLAGLGGHLEQVVVDVGMFGHPVQRNPLTHGKRDVRRLEVPLDAAEVKVNVHKERVYRITDILIPGVTEERIVSLSAGSEKIGIQISQPKERTRQDWAKQVAAAAKPGTVGLWEWCRSAGFAGLDSVPDTCWGVYSGEQNEEIESAFLRCEPSVAVSIGIRSYSIVFDTVTSGRQIDHQFKKKRHIRRRVMTVEQREEVLRAAVEALGTQDTNLVDEDCAICCTSFSETPHMPIVRTMCGHAFHGACVQHQADQKSSCPLCRADVDWAVVMRGLRT